MPQQRYSHRGGQRGRGGNRGGRGDSRRGSSSRGRGGFKRGPIFSGTVTPIQDLTAPVQIIPPPYISPLPQKRVEDSERKLTIVSNNFPISFPLDAEFFQYDLKFSSELPKRERYRLFESVPELQEFVFDGECIAFSCANKGFPKKVFQVTNNGKEIEIVLERSATLNAAKQVNQNFLQMISIVLRHSLRKLGLTRIGRNLFDMDNSTLLKEHNVEILPGLVSTIKMSQKGFLLQVDTVYRVLRTSTFLDEIKELKTNKKVEASVKDNPTFYCSYNQRTIRVDGVDFNLTPEDTFRDRTGKDISFVRYYQDIYGININDRKQPLLFAKKKDGSVLYFVPELVNQTGLTDSLRRRLKSSLIKEPDDRLADSARMGLKYQETPAFKESIGKWSINIGQNLLTVPAHQLKPPKLIMGNGNQVQPSSKNDYTWGFDLPPFRKCDPLGKWFILAPTHELADKMESCICKHIDTTSPPEIKIQNQHNHYSASVKSFAENGHTFGVVVLPSSRDEELFFQAAKKCATTIAGIPIQCIKQKVIEHHKFGQIQKALAAQVTAKCQGAPWKVGQKFGKSVVLGFDVFHAGVGSKNPSVAAIVGSYDNECTHFMSRAKKLDNGREVHESDFFYNFVKDILLKYKEHNKEWPKYVFMYRDGIGVGQIPEVKRRETQKIRKALSDIQKDYQTHKIKLTACVIVKRINERFYNIDKHGNVSNIGVGTVIDKYVVGENCFEFFLNAAPVAQGTATPIHVIVIHNDSSDMPVKLFQKMTFALCHGYWNFARSIKVPAHCHLAHKMAGQIGEHCGGVLPTSALETSLFYL